MPGVHIVTDSSCDLAEDEMDQLDVDVVPLSIRFGDEEFTDGLDLTVAEFYRRMATSDELPQTACPSPGAFEEAYQRASEAGADAVVCLTISGDLSNTIQSACTASEALSGQVPVHVVDSRTVSSGLGTIVLEAARTARGLADVEAVLARVRSLIPRTHVFAALNTLENLKKGGRIGGAKAMLGSILSIKPVIDITGGVVEEAGKPRTRRKAMHLLYERMIGAGPIEDVAVMHGGAPDIGEFLDLIAPRFPRESIRLGQLGAVIGAHGGSEIIGVSWVAAT
ncbi:MAG: DegV family protein [Acidimicrobiales bacterium]|jgi:DegV family protein with EDD domain